MLCNQYTSTMLVNKEMVILDLNIQSHQILSMIYLHENICIIIGWIIFQNFHFILISNLTTSSKTKHISKIILRWYITTIPFNPKHCTDFLLQIFYVPKIQFRFLSNECSFPSYHTYLFCQIILGTNQVSYFSLNMSGAIIFQKSLLLIVFMALQILCKPLTDPSHWITIPIKKSMWNIDT